MKFKIYVTIILATIVSGCSAPRRSATNVEQKFLFDRTIANAVEQYKVLAGATPEGFMPNSYNGRKVKAVKAHGWTSGFYPGTLLYLYKLTKDQYLYREALKRMTILDTLQNFTGHHDIGFIMNCSYGNLYSIDQREKYKQILVNSARALTKRFNSKVGCIRSWGKIDDNKEFLVIIDNLMNLELLLLAYKLTGDTNFYNIAVTHANTTLKNHFRSDNSSYHVVEYDPQTGDIIKKRTAQGAADESAWARGQAWGLYGYTMLYRETKNVNYLNQAQKIASFILTHPNLPEDKVPYWDFNARGIPNTIRDASAGAIIASALIELSKYSKQTLSATYSAAAQQILQTLGSPEYTAVNGTEGGFVLKHSVANKNRETDVDVPLIYADYYYIEALLRMKSL